ncbi:MAG: hypothetical protein Q9M43_04480 [Sulfurimonas sp.]|nr:hypothetical protein [Sulfurimonas sp.]
MKKIIFVINLLIAVVCSDNTIYQRDGIIYNNFSDLDKVSKNNFNDQMTIIKRKACASLVNPRLSSMNAEIKAICIFFKDETPIVTGGGGSLLLLVLSGFTAVMGDKNDDSCMSRPDVKLIVEKYKDEYEKDIAINFTTCKMRVIDLDIDEWDENTFSSGKSRDIEVKMVVNEKKMTIDDEECSKERFNPEIEVEE